MSFMDRIKDTSKKERKAFAVVGSAVIGWATGAVVPPEALAVLVGAVL